MAEKISIHELRDRVLLKKLKKEEEMVSELDPSKDDYVEKVKEITRYMETVNDDIRNRDEIIVESTKLKEERKNTIIRTFIQGLSIAATIFVTVFSERQRNHRFDRATAKEADEAILTLTDRTTVQEGLKEKDTKSSFLSKLF